MEVIFCQSSAITLPETMDLVDERGDVVRKPLKLRSNVVVGALMVVSWFISDVVPDNVALVMAVVSWLISCVVPDVVDAVVVVAS